MESGRTSDTESVVVVTPAEMITTTATDEPQSTSKDAQATSDEPKKEEKKVFVGLVSESKDLYGTIDENGNRSWTDKRPNDLEEAAENEETLKYAVIIRKKKPREADSTKPLIIDSIIVQSPYLKAVLGEVFHEYPGVITDVSRLTFSAPFECFVHRWDRFESARSNPEHDTITKGHIELLYNIMKAELGDVITLRADYFKNRAVSFRHVWTLFPPGCIVWGSQNGKPVGIKFQHGYYTKTQCGEIYLLNCKIIEWDGVIMGWADCDQRIGEFLGTVPFSKLPCYPLQYHPQVDLAKDCLMSRGRKWEGLAGYYYKSYKGTATWNVDSRKQRKENVESRIVIDGANWEKANPDWVTYIEQFHETDYDFPLSKAQGDRDGGDEGEENGDGDDDDDDDNTSIEIPQSREQKHLAALVSGLGLGDKRTPLTDDQLILTSPIVRGYALKNKRWMEFFVDDVAEVTFNERAFESLVLEEEQKDLILAFAQSQVKFKDAFDDVISGKGKGIIMLLSGGPGIGKTLTAESVAEEMRVPIYIMSAGDLGADAYSVEEKLGEILEMVANWNAVLLLDECDVFLEERSAHDMERNRVVSIFLRMLEYYEGILFLTTNRVSNIDPAFQSRIHMTLEYPPLDAASRETVWRGFLGRTVSFKAVGEGESDKAHDVTDDQIVALAGLDLNGRQIKNVLKTANLLACSKKERLTFRHLKTVLRVEGHSLLVGACS